MGNTLSDVVEAAGPRVVVEAGGNLGHDPHEGLAHLVEVTVGDTLPGDVLIVEMVELGPQGGGVVEEVDALVKSVYNTDTMSTELGGVLIGNIDALEQGSGGFVLLEQIVEDSLGELETASGKL